MKTFVLDTNVLLHDPESIFSFAEHRVVLSIVVIEEVDRFKKELTEVGRNARQVSRILDKLRSEASITEGVTLPSGGTLQIHLGVPAPDDFPFLESAYSADMRILALARHLADGDGRVVLITKDTNLRIKADALGIRAEDYVETSTTFDGDAIGWKEVPVSKGAIDRLYGEGTLSIDEIEVSDPGPNHHFLLRDVDDESHTALARRARERAELRPIRLPKEVSGIRARNLEQRFALDLLLDDEIPLVCLLGKAGTGKTLLALAAGMSLTVDQERYNRLLVARPIYPMGRDLGYLPGEIDEKLRPWMQPIFDNLEQLGIAGEPVGRRRDSFDPIEQLIEQGLIEIEALTYIRGRSLAGQYMIVDEAQNLTPHEVKTIITRAGEGSKVVLTGDPDQIDNPYVDAASNGLSYASERTADEVLAATAVLSRGERSPLAAMAADKL